METGTNPMNILWVIIMFMAFLPAINKKIIEFARQRMIARIESKRNSKIILIVHRQESLNLLGIPLMRYITMEDSEQVLRALESTEEGKDIDIVLHTPGGLAIASLQIARAIKNCKRNVRVIIPHYAMSGGTLIALAAKEILMSPNAVFGPIDPQVGQFPAPSLKKLLEIKNIDKIDDSTVIYADLAEKSTNQLQESIVEIMEENYGNEKAQQIASVLTEGKWTHDFPINSDIAQQLGIHVRTDIPDEFMKLMSMYPQATRRSKTVEYLPSGK